MGDTSKAAVMHLLIGAFFISFSPVFAKLAGSATTMSGFYRMFFGLIGMMLIILMGKKLRRADRRGLIVITASGLFFSLDIFFWHKSIYYTGPGLSTLIANFQVFFLAFLDVAVFRQKFSYRLLAAVVLAFCGLYLLVGIGWGDRPEDFKYGVFYGVLTAVMYAGYIVTLRIAGMLKEPVDKRTSIVVVSIVSCVVLGVSAVSSGESLAIPSVDILIYLVAYGFLCQAAGWMIIASALPKTKLTVSGLILLLQPTLAYIWDVVFFDKQLTNTELTGALLALSAIYLGTIRSTGEGR